MLFDLSNVERGPRSIFWDHSQHFRTNGFHVIAQNTTNFRVKWLFKANFWVKYGCNAPIWKLKEIFISSLWHLKEIYISFWNNTNTSFSTFWCGLKAARFRVKCCFREDIFTLSCPHLKTLKFDLTNVEMGPRCNFWDHLQQFRTNDFCVIKNSKISKYQNF